jgi:hypothetical protein
VAEKKTTLPTNEQREAVRAYVRRDLMPLIESVLVKRLSVAAVFMRDELNKPAADVPASSEPEPKGGA